MSPCPAHVCHRRGMTLVAFLAAMPVLLGFAALAIDVCQLHTVKAELQNAADAAALAGVSVYLTDAGLSQNVADLNDLVRPRAQYFSLQNQTLSSGTILDVADVVIGTQSLTDSLAAFDTSGSERYNAVQVTVRRTADGPNGAVPLFFAHILGMGQASVTATSIAAIDDRLAGVRTEEIDNIPFLPITVDLAAHDALLAGGGDNYSYSDSVLPNGDGISEATIFPDDGGVPGNFGLLEFGAESTSDLQVLVSDGVSTAALEAEVGTSELTYFDAEGNPTTYDMAGLPGFREALEGAFAGHTGNIVAFFVHDAVSGSGNNSVYQNAGIRFGRIMYVDLDDVGVVIQPVTYTGPAVTINEHGSSTNGQFGRVLLAG